MARGDIVYVDLPALPRGGGHEQMGQRPALIVHDDTTSATLSVIMIAPFTTNLNAASYPHTIYVQPTPQNGLMQPSVLLVFQLRAIDRRRLRNKIGKLEGHILKQVNTELRAMLGL